MSSKGATSLPQTRKTLLDKLAYGFGSIAFGVKDNGFTVLLMIFYNQALGLPAKAVGLAIMIALVVDALSDPIVGHWSDNMRSRLGRRHPFMYAAALPVAVSYFFLWNPPAGLSENALFAYLLGITVLIRLFITMYEIPSSALVVDLAQDYHERTSFLSYRYFFGWIGGLSMGIAAFSLFLRPSAQDSSGQLNLSGYSNYGLTASLLMLVAILVSALGTQRHIPTFRQPEPRRKFVLSRSVRELRETLGHRPFLILLGSGLFSYASAGIAAAILTYFRIYFWELSGDQISLLMVGNFASVVVALFLAPKLGVAFGKKKAIILFSSVGMLLGPVPYLGRLLDLVPANGTGALFWFLFGTSFINTVVVMSAGILGSSMMADVVEDSATRTGRHSAGLFFSANAFIMKCVSGLGVFGAGLILDAVSFPQGAKRGDVPADVLNSLAIFEPMVIFGLSFISLLFVINFPITKERHEENLRRLSEDADQAVAL
ncbi:MFS transporter [Sphingomonas sp.]|jgi:Na+/melibiose symporter-like transporter|uniref:MFS transporter n=1 Tax=Sphingomonas sp. TaxID=28214 RepID=UPI00261EAF39|nr:MFS transporter [Sphingomonas sp.]MDF2496295.1 hypothetical protein [Sphingomonas sp.]